MTLNMIGVVVCVALVFLLVVSMKRHQTQHCNHLHHLSDALVGLVAFIDERVPGELPEETRSFVADYTAEWSTDEYVEEPVGDKSV
jgi:NADH:ubiquinone oxidoreductase subunit H